MSVYLLISIIYTFLMFLLFYWTLTDTKCKCKCTEIKVLLSTKDQILKPPEKINAFEEGLLD